MFSSNVAHLFLLICLQWSSSLCENFVNGRRKYAIGQQSDSEEWCEKLRLFVKIKTIVFHLKFLLESYKSWIKSKLFQKKMKAYMFYCLSHERNFHS